MTTRHITSGMVCSYNPELGFLEVPRSGVPFTPAATYYRIYGVPRIDNINILRARINLWVEETDETAKTVPCCLIQGTIKYNGGVYRRHARYNDSDEVTDNDHAHYRLPREMDGSGDGVLRHRRREKYRRRSRANIVFEIPADMN
jgi:hypothetical protein